MAFKEIIEQGEKAKAENTGSIVSAATNVAAVAAAAGVGAAGAGMVQAGTAAGSAATVSKGIALKNASIQALSGKFGGLGGIFIAQNLTDSRENATLKNMALLKNTKAEDVTAMLNQIDAGNTEYALSQFQQIQQGAEQWDASGMESFVDFLYKTGAVTPAMSEILERIKKEGKK